MRSVVEIGATVPAFLGKLWKLVNDSETNHLISWSPGGKTFVIKNQADFARELLPLYYKHNNMASFIRQLNMYGFHKITSVENGGLRYEKDEIEFTHPCFMRGHAYLLEHIKRKIANPKSIVASNESGEKILLKPELMNKVLADVKQMKGKQESLDAKFSAMKQENEALWREVAILRQKHIKQQQIVNNLIQFLMSLVQPTRPANGSGNTVGVKRPYQLMINNAAHNAAGEGSGKPKNAKLDKALLLDINEDNLEEGPTIHELAHDDILQNDASQDSISTTCFVNNVSPTSIPNTNSPIDPNTLQYHVTLEEGDDIDAVDQLIMEPVISNVVSMSAGTSNAKRQNNSKQASSPADKGLLSPSNYHAINPSADLRLPAEIFASDDSVSDAGVTANEEIDRKALNNIVQDTLLSCNTQSSKDQMLGGINIKVERPDKQSSKNSKKNKGATNDQQSLNLADIKTELLDDLDWNNMTLATVNNNPKRFQAVSRRDNTKNREEFSSQYGSNSNKGEIDDHLDSMQTDIDSLRELLRSDNYSLDTNTILGNGVPSMTSLTIPGYQHPSHDYLFGGDDPFYGLSYNPVDERTKASNGAEGNELISYTGNIPDFDDISMPELEDNSREGVMSPETTLNSPQVEVRAPAYGLRP